MTANDGYDPIGGWGYTDGAAGGDARAMIETCGSAGEDVPSR